MVLTFLLSGFLITVFLMTIAKRITALIRAFRLQSIFLFLYTVAIAMTQKHVELLVVAGLILALKVVVIPYLLTRIVRRIKVEEDLGLIVNPQLSLVTALLLSCLAYLFAQWMLPNAPAGGFATFVVSMTAICVSFFVMVSRLKALSQVLGLLAMENGLFLTAAAITGGLPFFVEIAFSFDILVFVIITEVFVYRVNRLWTHIDTARMNSLKG